MIRAVIFDCFGVVITDALQLIREEVAASDASRAAEITDIVAANNRGFLEPSESNRRIAELIGVTPDELRARISGGEAKDSRLLDYIAGLRPRYKTAMLSNIAGTSLRRRFEVGELERSFDLVVASGDIGFAKPEPEAYGYVLETLGVSTHEAVFTDDRAGFCEAASALGIRSILYTDFTQFSHDLTALLEREE